MAFNQQYITKTKLPERQHEAKRINARPYGQLNISKTHAIDLSENLYFIEECIQNGLTGLALEVADELTVTFKNSTSLLLKIMLRELTDNLKSPRKKSRQTLTLNALNFMVLTRCQDIF